MGYGSGRVGLESGFLLRLYNTPPFQRAFLFNTLETMLACLAIYHLSFASLSRAIFCVGRLVLALKSRRLLCCPSISLFYFCIPRKRMRRTGTPTATRVKS